MPAKTVKAGRLSVIFRLGNLSGRKAPPRRCPFQKPTASLHVHDFAAPPPQRYLGRDVHRFLRMRLQYSWWANLSYGFIKFAASLWRSSWRVSQPAARECLDDKCSPTRRYQTYMRPGSTLHNL